MLLVNVFRTFLNFTRNNENFDVIMLRRVTENTKILTWQYIRKFCSDNSSRFPGLSTADSGRKNPQRLENPLYCSTPPPDSQGLGSSISHPSKFPPWLVASGELADFFPFHLAVWKLFRDRSMLLLERLLWLELETCWTGCCLRVHQLHRYLSDHFRLV